MYTVVDLFAGAGGLSLGFMQTNKYKIKVAFENQPNMQETYRKNHPGVDVRGNVCEADYTEIKRKYGEIDIVIGGPPCQGFSNANRQKNTAISQNNLLVKEYIRAISELKPKAFVMENVSMLKSDVHRFYLDEKDKELFGKTDCKIKMTDTKLILLDKEFCFDGAIEIVRSEKMIDQYLWPKEDYLVLNVIYKFLNNPSKTEKSLIKYKNQLQSLADKYCTTTSKDHIEKSSRTAFQAISDYFGGKGDIFHLREKIEPAIMQQRMLSKAKEIFTNHIVAENYFSDNGISAVIKSYAVFDYVRTVLENNYTINSDVLCAANFGAPQKRKRFVVIGLSNSKDKNIKVKMPKPTFDSTCYTTVKDAIGDLESVETKTSTDEDIGTPLPDIEPLSPLARQLRDTSLLFNHVVTKTTDVAMERFKALKQGQNFHSLKDELKKNTYTDIARTQNTIYLRLDYSQPSGTVVNVRKSMWVHPTLNRAISVREAARLQTFPDSFVFCGTKDKQYQQVGNAVPPILAKAIAESLAEQLADIDPSQKGKKRNNE